MTSGQLDGRHGPHVLVADITNPVLADDDRHHLERVLRLRDGDPFTVGDGRGSWRTARFGDGVKPDGDVEFVESSLPTLRVGFALIKGGRPELVVQKLTEIGIDIIQPVVAERSVVHWDETKSKRNVARLERVAREAVMQCRRPYIPEIRMPVAAVDVARESGVALAEPHSPASISLAQTSVIIGPEGGFTASELAAAEATVGLGTTILRAETAAFVAATLLVASRSGWSSPNGL